MFSAPLLSLQIPPQHARREQLAHAERATDPPAVEDIRTARVPQQREAGGVIEQRDVTARARQVGARGERPDAKTDRPETWQQRHQRGARVREADRDRRPAGNAWEELSDYPARPSPPGSLVADHVVMEDLAGADKPGTHRDRTPV